jgi:hypothetical protein
MAGKELAIFSFFFYQGIAPYFQVLRAAGLDFFGLLDNAGLFSSPPVINIMCQM